MPLPGKTRFEYSMLDTDAEAESRRDGEERQSTQVEQPFGGEVAGQTTVQRVLARLIEEDKKKALHEGGDDVWLDPTAAAAAQGGVQQRAGSEVVSEGNTESLH